MYQLGAINVNTNEYVFPYKAEQHIQYKCIGCQQKVFLKKGNIRKAYFSHYSQINNCSYYKNPDDSILHNEAKYKLVSWLKENKNMTIMWECCQIVYPLSIYTLGHMCGATERKMKQKIQYDENDKAVFEYRDDTTNCIADVAIINNDKLKYVFNITNTQSTIPEPWFAINATEIFKIENENKENILLTCIRNSKNRYCGKCRILDDGWIYNVPMLCDKNGWETNFSVKPCVKCNSNAYSPTFAKVYRQLCTLCLYAYENELKEEYGTHNPLL